ncbi:hypothetical protein Bca101_101970 [Brassica carinata]
MDVKNAFLQGELEDEVYMHPPPGLEHLVKRGNVLRLKKAIYGLKQSPRAWYNKLSTTLNGRGFKKSELDHTLFTLTTPSGMIALLVYVDDIIITGSDKEGIIATKEFIKSMFEIKDLGEMKYFLGIEICRSKEGLFMSQRKYTLDLLKGAGAYGGKTARMPMEDRYKVPREGEIEDSKPYQDPKLYRKLVGKLIYLTISRPDICFAVNQVSQHMQVPKEHHWRMVERILMYLNGSPDQGVWMGCNGSTEVVGYCDADWAGDRADRRSTTGYCTFIGGNLVTWKSKKQKMESGMNMNMKVAVCFKGNNYLVWSRMVRTTVGSKGLWKHITPGEAPKLITQGEGEDEAASKAEEKWHQEDMLVMSVLHASLEPAILDAYSYCESAKELWDTLKKVYGNTSNLSRVVEVKQAINNLVQEDMEFTKHLGRFRTLWSEMEMLRPSTTDADELNKRREQDKVFGLLLTMNPAYNSLIQHLLREDTLPDLEEVCARIQKEQGSIGLFGKKGEMSLVNRATQEEGSEAPC